MCPVCSPGSGVASVVVTVVTAPVACAEVTVVVMVGMAGDGFGAFGEERSKLKRSANERRPRHFTTQRHSRAEFLDAPAPYYLLFRNTPCPVPSVLRSVGLSLLS